MLELTLALIVSQTTHYAIDPAQTELVVLTRPAGLLSGASHPHVVVARKVSGEVVYDAAVPEAASVTVSFPADALENDEPGLRKRFGLETVLSPEDRQKVGATLRSAEQLDVKRYPMVGFTSREVSKDEGGHLRVSGTMTLRGVAVALTLPVTVSVKDGVLEGRGSVGITHAMFGMKPVSAALGTIRNAEEMTLDLHLVARAAAPDGGH